MRSSRPVVRIVLLTAVMAIVAACGSGESSDDDASASDSQADGETTTSEAEGADLPAGLQPQPLAETAQVTVSHGPAGEWASPFWLALETGEFEAENLEVNTEVMDTTTSLSQVGRGTVQVGVTGIFPGFVNAFDQGLPVTWVAPVHVGDSSTSGIYVRNEFLNSDGSLNVEKARGITVNNPNGINAASFRVMYQYFTEENGMEFDTDYNIESLQSPDSVVALENGAIGAAYLAHPYQVTIEESGIAQLVGGESFAASVYMANSDWLEDNEDAAAAFFRAIARTIAKNLEGDYKENPETLALLSEALEAPEDALTSAPPLEFDRTLAAEFEIDGFLQTWKDVGVIESDVEVSADDLVSHEIIDVAIGD